jgi:hypothetical protein
MVIPSKSGLLRYEILEQEEKATTQKLSPPRVADRIVALVLGSNEFAEHGQLDPSRVAASSVTLLLTTFHPGCALSQQQMHLTIASVSTVEGLHREKAAK